MLPTAQSQYYNSVVFNVLASSHSIYTPHAAFKHPNRPTKGLPAEPNRLNAAYLLWYGYLTSTLVADWHAEGGRYQKRKDKKEHPLTPCFSKKEEG